MSNELQPARAERAEKLDGDITWAWETWADSFNDLQELIENEYWIELGFSSALEYIKQQLMPLVDKAKLSVDFRRPIVKLLKDAGFSNRAIGSAVNAPESTIRNDVKAMAWTEEVDHGESAQGCASNQLDAAGQSGLTPGQIDDDAYSSENDIEPDPYVLPKVEAIVETDWRTELLRKTEMPMMTAGQLFGINEEQIKEEQTNIIEEQTEIIKEQEVVEIEYFQPRPRPTKPLENINPVLGPPKAARIIEAVDWSEAAPPEILDGDEEIEIVEEPVKEVKEEKATKHCKTCACNLLP